MKYNPQQLWVEICDGGSLFMREFLNESRQDARALLTELGTKDNDVGKILPDLNDSSSERFSSACVALCTQDRFTNLKAILVAAITHSMPAVVKRVLEGLHNDWDLLANISVPLAALGDLSGIFATLESLFAKQERYYTAWYLDAVNASTGRIWIRDLAPLVTPQLAHLVPLAVVASVCPEKPAQESEQVEATWRLCGRTCGFTTNTLILVSKKHDDSITESVNDGWAWETRSIIFDRQRELAIQELKKRGNPCYRSESWSDVA